LTPSALERGLHKVEQVYGKPSPLMAQAAMAIVGTAPEESLMVGDRLETDILMGQQAGMATALPLTGATSPAKLACSDVQPDYVLERLDHLLPTR
jgi:ribonucleotide monophosphatase NagD (HAD superfamily)